MGEKITPERRALGQRIQRAREDQRLEQKELGQLLGVTHTTVSRWERGASGLSASTLRDLQRLLDAPLADEPEGVPAAMPTKAHRALHDDPAYIAGRIIEMVEQLVRLARRSPGEGWPAASAM